MKKIFYPIIGFVILCLSLISSVKKAKDKKIEDQGSNNLILRPYQFGGLLWSCSPDHIEEDDVLLQEPTHYSVSVDSVTNSETHSSHYSSTHYSHSSQNHSSHYSSIHNSHSNHSSHYSSSHNSHSNHSSHYSGTHQSHQSHSSHSSHYSAK